MIDLGDHMTIKQLEYFAEVAKTLNYTTAAKNLFISQPALSRSISLLEEELGAVLFHRNRHKVSLTPAGITLMGSIATLKKELEKMKVLVQQSKDGLRGHLVLGLQEGIGLPQALVSSIQYLQEESPFIELDLVSFGQAELQNGLANGDFDAIFTYDLGESDSEQFEYMTLKTSAVGLACSSKHPGTGPDPGNQRYIFVGNESDAEAKQWAEHCQRQNLSPVIRYVPNTATQLFLIKNGYGVGVFPQDHDIFSVSHIRRVEIPAAYRVSSRLYWRIENPNPIISVFLELICGESDEIYDHRSRR